MTNKRVENKLTLEGVEVLFKNFSGNKTQYNAEGKRNFSILINDIDLAESLIEEGWNLRSLKNDEDDISWHIPVQINFEGRIPPRVFAIKTSGKLQLNEDTIAMLDFMRIKYVDLSLNPYNWSVSGETGVKAYLNTLYAIIDETQLDLKYEELPELAS